MVGRSLLWVVLVALRQVFVCLAGFGSAASSPLVLELVVVELSEVELCVVELFVVELVDLELFVVEL